MEKREQAQTSNAMTYLQASRRLTTGEKVGQLFMPAAFINDTEEEIQQLEQLIRSHCIGGLCFFHSRASAATNYEENLADRRIQQEVVYNENSFDTLKAMIKRYQAVAKYPLLIAIDAEWGLAMRIENTPQYPYAITLGAIEDKGELIFKVGSNIAADCRAAGIHWNLAPCVDINNNPNNPVIGYRSFGENKLKVTEKALAYSKGMQSEGVLTSIKHFPGHGDTATDSHLGLPLIDKTKEELLENELYPFQKLINEGVDSVMVGHLSVPALANGEQSSSSISKDIIKGVLRKEMGFKGVVISDALNMHAVSKNYPTKGELEWLAFDAGNDILCFAEHTAEGIKTILKNAPENQIEESFERIWKLKGKIISMTIPTHLELTDPDELNRKLAQESLTLLKGTRKGISEFLSNPFVAIENSHTIENQFFKVVEEHKKFTIFSLIENSLKKEDNILLALFPPQVKPTNDFGFSKEELIQINNLISTKNVMLYLFGNPYVLNHLDFNHAKAVVIAYQNFKDFQEVAAAHFLGNLEAKGELPVTLGNK